MNRISNPYADLIAMERAKIAEYNGRIQACLSRIAALEGLSVGTQDDVDVAIERKLLATVGHVIRSEHQPAPHPLTDDAARQEKAPSVSGQSLQLPELPRLDTSDVDGSSAGFTDPKREVSPQYLELLRHLAIAKSSDVAFEYVEARGFPMNRAAFSSFLYSYRTKYGFLKLTDEGFYVLTERGNAYISEPSRVTVTYETPDAVAAAPRVDSTQVDDLIQSEGTDREGGC